MKLGLPNGCRSVNVFEIGGNGLAVFPGDEFQGITDHVDNTELNEGVWKNGINGIGEAGKAVDTSNEKVGQAPILELGKDLKPEFGALGLLNPHAQEFLLSFHVDGQGKVYGLVEHFVFVANFDAHGIKVNDGVDGFQGSICHSLASLMTSLVTLETKVGETLTP